VARTPVINGRNNNAYTRFIESNVTIHSFTESGILSSSSEGIPTKSPIKGPTNKNGIIFDFLIYTIPNVKGQQTCYFTSLLTKSSIPITYKINLTQTPR